MGRWFEGFFEEKIKKDAIAKAKEQKWRVWAIQQDGYLSYYAGSKLPEAIQRKLGKQIHAKEIRIEDKNT